MSSPASATNSSATAVASTIAGGSASSAPANDAPEIDQEALVYHVSLLVLSFIALLFVLRIPRAFNRLLHWSEFSQGHILRYVSFHNARAPRIVHVTHDRATPKEAASSDESHTYQSHSTHIQRIDEKGSLMVMNYPTHIASSPSFLRGLASELSTRLSPGYSLAQGICALVYLACWIYPTLYKSNPFTDPDRAGWVGIAQLPFVFAFGTKNNVLGPFLGMGYEKLNFMHRMVGRIMLTAVNVHSLGYIYKWLIQGVFHEKIIQPSNYWGFIGLVSIDLVFFFSTSVWRTRAYHFFIATHISGFSLLLAACWMHKQADRPFVLAAIGLYAFDHLMRCIKTRIQTATIRAIPQLGSTRLELPYTNAGWRAGQHVRLRVLSSGMGIFGWSEVHPFTIASAHKSQEGMVLMIKKAGDWTTKLYEIAESGKHSEAGFGTNVKVMIDGPYGGPGHSIPSSHSAAVFVAGGSGITYALSGIQELIDKDLKGESRVKIIELIWIVQDPAALVPLVPTFSAMIQQSVFTPVRISVFYTRAVIGKFPFSKDFFHPRLSLSPGRPKISNMLEATISKTVTLGAGIKDREAHTGLMVAVCGPTALADDVAKEVGRIDPVRRDQVGGVEIHEDAFGW